MFFDDVCWVVFFVDVFWCLVVFVECVVGVLCLMIFVIWLRCVEVIVAIENLKCKCARLNCACRITGDENVIGEML